MTSYNVVLISFISMADARRATSNDEEALSDKWGRLGSGSLFRVRSTGYG
jgi:hypothetical protein